MELKKTIEKATLGKALLFTIIFVMLYILINFTPVGVSGLLKITNGANILDFEFGYSRDKAYHMIAALGEDGRSFYLTKIIPMDFPFPFAYMLCYAGWISLLIKYIAPLSAAKYLTFVPLFAMLFDWLENLGIILMLSNYPNMPLLAIYTASISGILKTLFTLGSISIILVSLTVYIVKKKRKG
jgi:hypothetical protein